MWLLSQAEIDRKAVRLVEKNSRDQLGVLLDRAEAAYQVVPCRLTSECLIVVNRELKMVRSGMLVEGKRTTAIATFPTEIPSVFPFSHKGIVDAVVGWFGGVLRRNLVESWGLRDGLKGSISKACVAKVEVRDVC